MQCKKANCHDAKPISFLATFQVVFDELLPANSTKHSNNNLY